MSEGGEASQTVSITRHPQVVGSSPRGGGGQSGGSSRRVGREGGPSSNKSRGSVWCEVIRVRDFEWQSVWETESHRPEGTKRG